MLVLVNPSGREKMKSRKHLCSILVLLFVIAGANKQDARAETLHDAAAAGDFDQVQLLISKGVDVNTNQGPNRRTALHWAAYNGHTKVAELLISKGAAVNVKDEEDYALIHTAAARGHGEVVEVLISKGADVDIEGNGKTPLSVAAGTGHELSLIHI